MSTRTVTFPTNKISTQKINITSEGLKNGPLFVRHSLPKCFTVQKFNGPIENACEVTVTLNPLSDDGKAALNLKDLKINFVSISGDEAPITVRIVMKDEEDTRSASLSCQICLREYSEEVIPRILVRCGHTVCEMCIRYIAKYQPVIKCPFDRIESWGSLQNMPKNFALLEVIQEKAKEETPKNSEDNKSAMIPCFENSHHESDVYCNDCKENFCQNCFNTSHSSRILSNHQFISILEKPVTPPKCSIHPGMTVSLVCKDTLICTACAILDHSNHQHLAIKEVRRLNQSNLSGIQTLYHSIERKFQRIENIEDLIIVNRVLEVIRDEVERVQRHLVLTFHLHDYESFTRKLSQLDSVMDEQQTIKNETNIPVTNDSEDDDW